jgi:hypothetical protein
LRQSTFVIPALLSHLENLISQSSICQLDFDVDIRWQAYARYAVKHALIRADIENTLMDAQLPRFPVASAASAVHAITARRFHARHLEDFRRQWYRPAHGYANLLRKVFYLLAEVVKLLWALARQLYARRLHVRRRYGMAIMLQ